MNTQSRWYMTLMCALISCILILPRPAPAQRGEPQLVKPLRAAPSLTGAGEWINSAGPLQLANLRGKIVILDFWTYCCSNCMHILPELKKLERAYPNNVVVIGVHSGKFATEHNADNIREAVLRHEIEHPVLNDPNHLIWRRYNVRMWPTLCIIDPTGRLLARHEGEIRFPVLDRFLRNRLAGYRKMRQLDETPLRFELESHVAKATPLKFPGKVLADETSRRLFISDSNHNRIVITSLDGNLIDVVGSGAIGKQDGSYQACSFNHPQGLALFKQSLYVADTENHLIRKVDLDSRKVSTVSGTGRQASVRPRPGSRHLNSPWDLCLHKETIYIAMAGAHQLWKLSTRGGIAKWFSGNGVEDIVDGRLKSTVYGQLGYASYAQPSGLATDGKWLYVADSEGSSIRAVPLRTGATRYVQTVLGTSALANNRLFTFGDRDGRVSQALLQHPLGIVSVGQRLFIADTYNNKIKMLDLQSRVIRTLAGTPQPGNTDNPPRFDEPAGISYAAGKLYVADTNNHSIRVLDLNNRTVSTLVIDRLPAPNPTEPPTAFLLPGSKTIKFEPAHIQAMQRQLVIDVQLQLPVGNKLNSSVPLQYTILQGDFVDASLIDKLQILETDNARFNLRVPLRRETGQSRFELAVKYFYCQEGLESVCRVSSVKFAGEVHLSSQSGRKSLQLRQIAP
ncbi:MAG TPA: hypothetical protein DCE55_03335 [Planctomycetaceae bacterium]|nr:hypothetical protein [Planctomycetaceae bacterium]